MSAFQIVAGCWGQQPGPKAVGGIFTAHSLAKATI